MVSSVRPISYRSRLDWDPATVLSSQESDFDGRLPSLPSSKLGEMRTNRTDQVDCSLRSGEGYTPFSERRSLAEWTKSWGLPMS